MIASFASTFPLARPRYTVWKSLRKAIAVLTPELLQFGSDVFLPCSGELIKSRIDEVSGLLEQLDLDKPSRERIMGGTAAAWLGVKLA